MALAVKQSGKLAEVFGNPMIDSERYPLGAPDSADYLALADDCRQRFADEGVALLPGFVRSEAITAVAAEASALIDKAFFCHNDHNIYLSEDEASHDPGHPRRRLLHTDVGSIANDYISPDSPLQQLYDWEPLAAFIADVVGVDRLFVSADPLGALSINVFKPGDAHAWHFDEAHFTVTLMVQAAESGGHFEYVTGLRDDGADGDTAALSQLLDDTMDTQSIARLPFAPGTLSIFNGRHTIHRVTEVAGAKPRLVPVLTFSDAPGYCNSDAVRELFWGRAS